MTVPEPFPEGLSLQELARLGQFGILYPDSIQGWEVRWNNYDSCNYSVPPPWWAEKVQPLIDAMIQDIREGKQTADYTAEKYGRIFVHFKRPDVDVEFYGRFT